MSNSDAFAMPEAALYQDFLIRCRIRRLPGEPPRLEAFRRYLNTARAGVDPVVAAGEDWQRVMRLGDTVPHDLQPVFYLLARAAMDGLPCPSDAEVARVCGTSSATRARSRIQYLDKQGIVVVRACGRNGRIVAVPDLGWETAEGDPAASAQVPREVEALSA
jgi:hypothetical protein